jgi:hypothetical protein
MRKRTCFQFLKFIHGILHLSDSKMDLHLSLRFSLGLTIPDTKLNKSNEFMCSYQT